MIWSFWILLLRFGRQGWIAPSHWGKTPLCTLAVGLLILRFSSRTGRQTQAVSAWYGSPVPLPRMLASAPVSGLCIFCTCMCWSVIRWIFKWKLRQISKAPSLFPFCTSVFSVLFLWTRVSLLSQNLSYISSTENVCWALPKVSLQAQVCGIPQGNKLGQLQGQPHLFPSLLGSSLPPVAWYSLSCKPSCVHFFGCLKCKEKSQSLLYPGQGQNSYGCLSSIFK